MRKNEPPLQQVTQPPSECQERQDAFSGFLPKLNVKDGMDRLGADLEIYASILQAYFNQYRDISQNLKALLKAGKDEEVFREIHTLKGASGNVSASTLTQISMDLEEAFINKDLDKMDSILPIIETELEYIGVAANQLKATMSRQHNS